MMSTCAHMNRQKGIPEAINLDVFLSIAKDSLHNEDTVFGQREMY